MAEDRRTQAGADEELLRVDPVSGTAPEEDLRVIGKHKSHKKKKSKVPYTLLIILLLGIMGFSGYKIAATLVRDKQAEDVYSNIESNFVVELPDTTEEAPSQTPAATKPVQTEPVVPGESTEPAVTESGETEETETQEETPPATTEPAPDPMRILSVDFAKLKSVNSDVVAWIQGQGGSVSYPVVQGRDNVYYLKHLIDGSYNGNGTLFVHCENKFLQDDVTYIFGHHMYGGAMFGRLVNYDSTEYYWKNQEFRLYTPEKTYTLRIYAVMYGTGTEQITFNYANEEDFNRGMQVYASRALHPATVPVSYGDKLVCLCTCAYHVDNGRYFVYCKVME